MEINENKINPEILLLKSLDYFEKPSFLIKYCIFLLNIFEKNYNYKSEKFNIKYFLDYLNNTDLIRKIQKLEKIKENNEYAMDYYDKDLHKGDTFLFDKDTELIINEILINCLEFLSELLTNIYKEEDFFGDLKK